MALYFVTMDVEPEAAPSLPVGRLANQMWCEDAGERPETKRKFGMLLKERGIADGRNSERTKRIWKGIGLSQLVRGSQDDEDAGDVSGGESATDKPKTTDIEKDAGHKTGVSAMSTSNTASREGNSKIVSEVSEVSEEQERRINKLVCQGMSEKLAREEVLGKGWVGS